MFEYAKYWTIPIETCRTYESKDPKHFKCTSEQQCHTNNPKGKKLIYNYPGLGSLGWGSIHSVNEMKHHLLKGPIVCYFLVTEDFVNYGPKEGETEF